MALSGVINLVGDTPIVELKGFHTGVCRLFLKLENRNPGGSIKDRIAVAMIDAAEKSGRLRPGSRIVEATAGNTGIGLAVASAAKGYPLTLIVPDKVSIEKISILRAYGADVRITRSDVCKGHPDYYETAAARISSEIPGAWFANQFANPANPLAHEQTTAPEIWEQMAHDVDTIVCGVGSGGTITGLSRYFARISPKTRIVLADPMGSALGEYVRRGVLGESRPYAVEGVGAAAIPEVADLSRVSDAITIDDSDSFQTTRDLLRISSILAGPSTGTQVAAALQYCKAQQRSKRVVTFACDTGSMYLSKVFSGDWVERLSTTQRAIAV